MSNYNELVAEYRKLTKSWKVDGRWSEATLADKIAREKARIAQRAADEAKREAEKEAARKAREARVAARGPVADFIKANRFSDNDEDRRLSRCMAWVVGVIADHEIKTAKLADGFAENPTHAMSWSIEFFTHAAQYQVARQLMNGYESGMTAKGVQEVAMREVMHKASNPSRSTSPTSNLVDQELLAAWTKAAKYMDGSELF